MVTNTGRACFQEDSGLSDAIAFAQMRRTVCQRLLEFYDEWQHRTNLMNAYP